MSAQLTLPVSHFDGASFDNFHAPEAGSVVTTVRQLVAASSPRQAVYLSGATGSGKTHLCWAACRAASELGKVPTYVPLKRPGVARAVLESVPPAALVCLDDVDLVAADDEWNQRLFSLLQHQYIDGEISLIVTARQAAAELEMKLADLRSRLTLLPGFRLENLSDDEKVIALKARAARRGMDIDFEVVDYILSRFARDTHALFGFLDQLDVDSISRQRKITIPFVRSLLEQQGT